MRLLKATPKGDQDNPRAYLFRISRNLAIDHHRRERVAPIEQISDAEFLAIAEVAEVISLSTARTWSLIRDAYRHIRGRLQSL